MRVQPGSAWIGGDRPRPSVRPVPSDGPVDRPEVDPDLMSATRFEANFEQATEQRPVVRLG